MITAIVLSLFTINNVPLAQKAFSLPLSSGELIAVDAQGFRCEIDSPPLSFQNNIPVPLHVGFVGTNSGTVFDGDIVPGRPMYIKLEYSPNIKSEVFCLIEWR